LAERRLSMVGRRSLATILLAALVYACDDDPTGLENAIRPGDSIGGATVTRGAAQIVPLFAFCSPAFSAEPGVVTRDCAVQPVPELAIGHGWFATDESRRAANWREFTWELYLDGSRVDLDAFGFFDADLPMGDVTAKLRAWDVVVAGLTPGAHTWRSVLHVREPVNDGFHTTPAGRYELVINVTVGG
jgi:hypothetical protein